MGLDTTLLRVPMHQVDAFARSTSGRFTGNPAAVVLLPKGCSWPDDATLVAIAGENNLSETAYVLEPPPTGDAAEDGGGVWRLRWFTPTTEVDLCGHATLATAHIIFTRVPDMISATKIAFETRSGRLFVERSVSGGDGEYCMTFPSSRIADEIDADVKTALIDALGSSGEVLQGGADAMVVLPSWRAVANAEPDMAALSAVLDSNGLRGLIATAACDGDEACDGEAGLDFVSRFFAPNIGVPEDPATGSAHCALAPFWASRRAMRSGDAGCARDGGTVRLRSKQLSRRGGYFQLEVGRSQSGKDITKLTGSVADYLDGIIDLEVASASLN